MLIFERIASATHPYFESAFSLYQASFPVFERRTRADQISALHDHAYHFDIIKSQEAGFLGILLTWQQADFLYIEHLAIAPEARGKQVGSETLAYLKKMTNKAIILEIDPPIDALSIKRKHFYEKADFIAGKFNHVHPSYRQNTQPHTLCIMSFPTLSEPIYQRFKHYLETHIMQYAES